MKPDKKPEKRLITYSPKAVREKNFETYPFTGDWAKLIGEPDVRFSSIIYGIAKSGKSTFCLQFAQYLSQFGKVLYVVSEELISKSLQLRISTYNITSPKIRFAATRKVDDLEYMIYYQRPRFVIVDSAQILGLGFKDFERLKTKYKRLKRSYHIVLQSDKSGNFKGGTEWIHETDCRIQLNNGVAYCEGRFNAHGTMRVFNNGQLSLFE